MRFIRQQLWLWCVVVVMTACATLAPADSDEWRNSQRAVLGERAKARWTALAQGNFEKAYEFHSPAYRAVSSLQHFRGSFGGAVAWRGAEVVGVEYDSPVSATVSVAVSYGSGVKGGGAYSSITYIHEKWVYSDEAWWYVAIKGG